MRSFTSLVSAAALVGRTVAFPQVMEGLSSGNIPSKRQAAPDPETGFDPALQYVSTTGDHAWVAPDLAGGDQRGPCPGLNAMANHGYLPHNGVGSHADFVEGTFTVFGMSADLSGFLTVLGATIDGNGLEWSIGGPSPALPGGAVLGQPQGISGSHNKYESDVSPGRGDLYQYGNDFTLQMPQYQQLYDMGMANGDNVTLDVLTDFRSSRFDDSVQNNPYFFNGPFTGVLVQPAAFTFIYRFMGNKSAEYPAGYLNTDVMNSFFGVTKNSDGSLTWTPGYERIPDNWYKRAVGDEYSIPFLEADTILAAIKYPKFIDVGGNLGKPNTFTGLDIDNLTGGAYNAQMLTQGNNLACFASEFIAQLTPDFVKCSGVLADATSAMSALSSQIASSFGAFNCPSLNSPNTQQFEQFPGYSDLNCASGQY